MHGVAANNGVFTPFYSQRQTFQLQLNRARFDVVVVPGFVEEKLRERALQVSPFGNEGTSPPGGLDGITFHARPGALPRAVQ